jgi:hypothetical protein
MTADSDRDSDGPPRVVIIGALVLAVAAIGAILVVAASRDAPQQTVALPPVPAPQAASPACQALIAALPQSLGDFQRVTIAQPAPEAASAWRSAPDSDPVVMRCGLERPDDFVVGVPIQAVDRVQWFRVSERAAGTQSTGSSRSTWYTVDRPVYVALTLPAGSGPEPIQILSAVIDRSIAATSIDPAPMH